MKTSVCATCRRCGQTHSIEGERFIDVLAASNDALARAGWHLDGHGFILCPNCTSLIRAGGTPPPPTPPQGMLF